MTGFQRKILFSVSNISMKKYFERKAKQTELRFTSNSYNPFRKIRKQSLLPTTTELRKPPKLRRFIHQPDELQDFLSADTIKDFNHLEKEKFCLNGFELKEKNGRLHSNL